MNGNKFNIEIRSFEDYCYNPKYNLVSYEDFFNNIIYDYRGRTRFIKFRAFGIYFSKKSKIDLEF